MIAATAQSKDLNRHHIPRILVAGTHSGCGKTTVARGIMQALVRRGLVVQPFKVGPDFIDPTHHSRICGRASRNLDPFLMGEDGVVETFMRLSAGADIAVIEGVMGTYDGLDGSLFASTAHVASLLEAPSILVVDVRGMARSAHAVIRGYSGYDSHFPLRGVVFNRIGSLRHKMLLERGTEVPVFGWIMRRDEFEVASRHLGLRMAFESSDDPDLAPLIEEFCDIDAILDCAASAPPLTGYSADRESLTETTCVGIAMDEAFCFYYQDNLDRLRQAGAKLIFWSPLHDRMPEADALYFGGGYPELHAAALSTGSSCKEVRTFADEGSPVLAECGGLIFMTEELTMRDEQTVPMSGVLPATTTMSARVQALGYTEGVFQSDIARYSGIHVRGHEFHYSRVEPARDARFVIRLSRGKGIWDGWDGLHVHRTIGTYTHAYFSDLFARQFIRDSMREP
jgi:cobyrinic acid a,c-diamide synthase